MRTSSGSASTGVLILPIFYVYWWIRTCPTRNRSSSTSSRIIFPNITISNTWCMIWRNFGKEAWASWPTISQYWFNLAPTFRIRPSGRERLLDHPDVVRQIETRISEQRRALGEIREYLVRDRTGEHPRPKAGLEQQILYLCLGLEPGYE